MAIKKRPVAPKPLRPIRAGVTLNPKRTAGCGGRIKKIK